MATCFLVPRVHSPSRDSAPLVASGVYSSASPPGFATRAPHWQRGYSEMTLTTDERECTEQLARFFPKLPAVRIPVQVTPRSSVPQRQREATVVEYATPEYAIFLSKLALEFDDRVRLVRDGGGRPVEAAVIALQYHGGRKAVAVRFIDGPCEWMKHT